jgi:hypothetical protein
MTAMDWDRATPEQVERLVEAVFDPAWESREAFRHMNDVLDAHKAGTATEEECRAAFAEFEQVSRETGQLQ